MYIFNPKWSKRNKTALVFSAAIALAAILGGLFVWPGVAQSGACADISPLPCEGVKLTPGIIFEFDGDDGGLGDANGQEIGFTLVDPPSKPGNPSANPAAPGYWPARLQINDGKLLIETTDGLNYEGSNSLDNALGVGLDLSNPIILETTLVDLPEAPGGFAQAGLWYGKSGIGPSGRGGTGTSEDDYLKLVVISDRTGSWSVQAFMEAERETVNSTTDPITPAGEVTLRLEINPSLGAIVARYCTTPGCDASRATPILTFGNVPSEWFSADAAGIDFNVGTRSFGGIMASNRSLDESQIFTFSNFLYESGSTIALITPKDGIDFETWSFSPVDKPTAMAMGPDNRLYVATVTGFIHAYSLDHETRQMIDDQVIDVVANRLMLGLAIDPDSTAEKVILWVAHSDLDQFDGDANSGTITRIEGPDFDDGLDVVTGLPRAIANHATNNIHFGPDGRLYIAQGGNTGAGAANDGGSEFGPRPEQPLSAAILVADVKQPGFDGSCTPAIDPAGQLMDRTGVAVRDVPCDVEVYASGLRNSYDFVFHSNGSLYATENGLGVVGTFPDLGPDPLSWDPARGCEGMIEGGNTISDHFPGDRTDLLQRIFPNAYYGHPNPSRDECIFFGGNPTDDPDYPVRASSAMTEPVYMDTDKYPVGINPAENFHMPLFSFGANKSANGIIEYAPQQDAFCGRLSGDLLVTYFSQSDQIRRLKLSPNGQQILWDETLIRSASSAGGSSLSNPLPITQDAQGRIYVGEFGVNKITVFDPVNVGVWETDGLPKMPVELLDAGSTVIDDVIYAVGGKTANGPQRAVYAYAPLELTWLHVSDLPEEYPAVENPAVAALDGKLYVFGGATEAFSGAIANAVSYDPELDAWTLLPDMPTARGGATAQAMNGLIYVAGGMDGDGESLTTVEIYNPIDQTWQAGPSMLTARDNPGSTVLDGKLYIFGGRTRQNGEEVQPRLSTVEFLEGNGEWNTAAPMPTGRRTMNVITYDGRAFVLGGEKTPEGDVYTANEAYDPVNDRWQLLTDMPVGRHGAIAGLVQDVIYLAGGGTTGGTSFNADVDAFYTNCSARVAIQTQLYMPLFIIR